MTFKEIQDIFESKFGATRLADIARELQVTPQVVSNWKARDQVPYKYVKKLRKLISKLDLQHSNQDKINTNIPFNNDIEINNQEDDFIDIPALIIFIIKHIRKKIIVFLTIPTVICSLQIVNVLYYIPPTYISTAKIMPKSGKSSASNIKGFASQFGINVGSQANSDISYAKLYPDILKSRTLSRRLLSRKFTTNEYGENQTLLKILTYGNENPPENLYYLESIAITDLIENKIEVLSKMKTPLITLSITASEAQFSADLATAIIDELNKMEKQYKNANVTEKRIFISKRIQEAEVSLKSSEEALKKFREENRNIFNSPALRLEETRLIREETVQTQIYLTLKKEYELVQIEEVENSSMVMVLDAPEKPLGSASPNRTRILIITGIISLLLSSIVILYKEIYKFVLAEIIK